MTLLSEGESNIPRVFPLTELNSDIWVGASIDLGWALAYIHTKARLYYLS